MITGLSLKSCIACICNGVVKEEDVAKIFTGTLANTREEFVIIIEDYSRSWWAKYPQKSVEMALRFWDSGKIEQPRVHDKVPFSYENGIWMDENQTVLQYDNNKNLVSTGEKVKLANYERWV